MDAPTYCKCALIIKLLIGSLASSPGPLIVTGTWGAIICQHCEQTCSLVSQLWGLYSCTIITSHTYQRMCFQACLRLDACKYSNSHIHILIPGIHCKESVNNNNNIMYDGCSVSLSIIAQNTYVLMYVCCCDFSTVYWPCHPLANFYALPFTIEIWCFLTMHWLSLW